MTRRGPRLLIQPSIVFAADRERCELRGESLDRLEQLVGLLAEGKPPPRDFRPHPVYTDFPGMMEGHVGPDFLLIYKVERRFLRLHRCGSHRELFPRSKYARA